MANLYKSRLRNLRCFNANERYWTTGAKECYMRGCVCENCPVNDILKGKCNMKLAVIEMVRKYGLSKDIQTKTIIES